MDVKHIPALIRKIEKDPYVKKQFEKHPEKKEEIQRMLESNWKLIQNNIKSLKKDKEMKSNRIMKAVLNDMEQEIHSIPDSSPHK